MRTVYTRLLTAGTCLAALSTAPSSWAERPAPRRALVARAQAGASVGNPEDHESRLAARSRFIKHLDSHAQMGSMTPEQKIQRVANLTARFSSKSPHNEAVGLDAALLMEMIGHAKQDQFPSVELAQRYGHKLMLARKSPNASAQVPINTMLYFEVHPPVGKSHIANDVDLELFGIKAPLDVKRLIGEAMRRVAPEDYE